MVDAKTEGDILAEKLLSRVAPVDLERMGSDLIAAGISCSVIDDALAKRFAALPWAQQKNLIWYFLGRKPSARRWAKIVNIKPELITEIFTQRLAGDIDNATAVTILFDQEELTSGRLLKLFRYSNRFADRFSPGQLGSFWNTLNSTQRRNYCRWLSDYKLPVKVVNDIVNISPRYINNLYYSNQISEKNAGKISKGQLVNRYEEYADKANRFPDELLLRILRLRRKKTKSAIVCICNTLLVRNCSNISLLLMAYTQLKQVAPNIGTELKSDLVSLILATAEGKQFLEAKNLKFILLNRKEAGSLAGKMKIIEVMAKQYLGESLK